MDADPVLQLAWTQIWQIAAVVALVAVAVRLFCRRRPHLAYALWLVVLLKCSVPPLWSSPTGVFSWAAPRHAGAATAANPPHNFEPEPAIPATAAEHLDRQAIIERLTQARLARTGKTADSPSDAFKPQPVSQPQANQPIAAPVRAPWSLPLSALVLVAWIAGSVVSGCWLAVRFGRLRRSLCVSSVPAPPQLGLLLAELRQALAVRRKVRVVVTSQPFGPALVGSFRPRIVVPVALVNEKTPDELRPMLAHELVHLRRGDHWIALVQCAANIVWWFHPAVWFANRQLVCQREICCDEEVVSGLNCDPAIYATMLLDVLRLRRLQKIGFMPAINALAVTSDRLAHIMRDSAQFRRRAPKSSWLTLAISCAIALPGAGSLLAGSHGMAKEPTAPRQSNAAQVVATAAEAKNPADSAAPFIDWTNTLDGSENRLVGPKNGSWSEDGVVVDHATGRPIAGATVRVVCSSKLSQQALQAILDAPPRSNSVAGLDMSYTTDATGAFKFQIVPDAPHAPIPNIGATISCPGYVPRTFPVRNMWDNTRAIEAGAPSFFPRSELFPAEEVRGTIVDPQGKPVAHVAVSSHFSDDDSTEYKLTAVSDEHGHFEIGVAKESIAGIEIKSPDPNWIDLQIDSALQHRDMGTLRFERGRRVTVEAVDFSGHPVPGVSIAVDAASAKQSDFASLKTGQDGRCTTRALPADDYAFEAWDGDGSVRAAFEPRLVHVADDRKPKLVRMHETAHVTLPLRVIDSAGKPLDCGAFWFDEHPSTPVLQMGLVVSRVPGKLEMNLPIEWRDVGVFSIINAATSAEDYVGPANSAAGKPIPVGPPNSATGEPIPPDFSTPGTRGYVSLRIGAGNGLDYVFVLRHGNHGEQVPPWQVDLGGMQFITAKDTKDLVATAYRTAPLIVAAYDPSGKRIDNFSARAVYASRQMEPTLPSEFHRPRSQPDCLVNTQIVPGEPFTVTVSAAGFLPSSKKMTLFEAEAKQVDFVLARAASLPPSSLIVPLRSR